MIPNLPIDESSSLDFEKLILCYAKASKTGRENIKRVAEMEVKYSTPPKEVETNL